MALTKERLQKRNAHVYQRFRYHKAKNPKWAWHNWIEAVAEDVFLSPATVGKILVENMPNAVPSVNTIIKYTTHLGR